MDRFLAVREKIQIIITKNKTRINQCALILMIFCIVFHMNITMDVVNHQLQEDSEEYIGPECVIPELDPFSSEVDKYYKRRKNIPDIACQGEDWVRCNYSTCRVVDNRLNLMWNISCVYNDIIYKSDKEYTFGPPTEVKDDNIYTLVDSDHVKVTCKGQYSNGFEWNWTYYCTGFRKSVDRKLTTLNRNNSLNILILMFDSTSRTSFIRNMPKSYEYLVTYLKGTILNGYNIVGKGSSNALFPILTGSAAYELPGVRKESNNNLTLDSLPFIFYKLKEQGYRTAYFEDMPWISTFQDKFNGFQHQPTDHYLKSFFMEEAVENQRILLPDNEKFCVGDTPQYQLMLNLTEQFMNLNGKRFCLTFMSDLVHDDIHMLSIADDAVFNLLTSLAERQVFEDTLVLIMGDHGPRHGKVRSTLHGRLEERLPFVCVISPEEFKRRRPYAEATLLLNANRWTTPFDLHTTLLDILDMPQHVNSYTVPGASIPRALSLLKPIPQNRSCWDAGIATHWCSCIAWRNVLVDDPFHQKVANALIRYINLLTDPVRDKCVVRTIIVINWVKRQRANKSILHGRKGLVDFAKENYQVKLVSGPDEAIYEASMTYVFKTKRFLLDIEHISRIDAYGNDSLCIGEGRPTLNGFCYCTV